MDTTVPEDNRIRFVDADLNDLLQLSDGACIQIHGPDETIVIPCEYIDASHTRIGRTIYDNSQFVKMITNHGATFMTEPAIMGDEAAWKIGDDRILTLQSCENGYIYSLFDENYNDIDGDFLAQPDLTMLEARTVILDHFHLHHSVLRAMVYEDVLSQDFEVGRQAVVVEDPICELAYKLDRFTATYDPYEYRDQVDDVEAHIQTILTDLRAGNTAPYRSFLDSVIAESRDMASKEAAATLIHHLNMLDLTRKPAMDENLLSDAEKAIPAHFKSSSNQELGR